MNIRELKEERKEIISKEELLCLNEHNMKTVLKVIFNHADILELEGVENDTCLKAHIKDMEWLYVQRISLEKNFVFTSKENRDRKSLPTEHPKPFVWGLIDIYDFRNFFEIYINSSFEEQELQLQQKETG